LSWAAAQAQAAGGLPLFNPERKSPRVSVMTAGTARPLLHDANDIQPVNPLRIALIELVTSAKSIT
jgi:hypothetical protein